jgi:hypothetical protein
MVIAIAGVIGHENYDNKFILKDFEFLLVWVSPQFVKYLTIFAKL